MGALKGLPRRARRASQDLSGRRPRHAEVIPENHDHALIRRESVEGSAQPCFLVLRATREALLHDALEAFAAQDELGARQGRRALRSSAGAKVAREAEDP